MMNVGYSGTYFNAGKKQRAAESNASKISLCGTHLLSLRRSAVNGLLPCDIFRGLEERNLNKTIRDFISRNYAS
jgi:hypothetical protein